MKHNHARCGFPILQNLGAKIILVQRTGYITP